MKQTQKKEGNFPHMLSNFSSTLLFLRLPLLNLFLLFSLRKKAKFHSSLHCLILNFWKIQKIIVLTFSFKVFAAVLTPANVVIMKSEKSVKKTLFHSIPAITDTNK